MQTVRNRPPLLMATGSADDCLGTNGLSSTTEMTVIRLHYLYGQLPPPYQEHLLKWVG